MTYKRLTAALASCVSTIALAVSAAPSDPDEVYTVLKEGKELAAKKQENDKSFGPMEKQAPQKEAENASLKIDEANWRKYAIDFNARCQRTFYKGEEGAMASCQAEANSGRPRDAELQARRKAADAWSAEFNALKQRRMELRAQEAVWRAKAALTGCSVSGSDLPDLVNSYQVCFDGSARNTQGLPANPAIGTRVSPNSR